MRVNGIVAMAENGVIGKGDAIPWRCSADMRRFKKVTSGHPVIMGRRTWEGLPERFRPLPGRTNIVLTRQSDYDAPGAIVVSSLNAALESARKAEGADEVFVMGGAEIYRLARPAIARWHLSIIEGEQEGDVVLGFDPRHDGTSSHADYVPGDDRNAAHHYCVIETE